MNARCVRITISTEGKLIACTDHQASTPPLDDSSRGDAVVPFHAIVVQISVGNSYIHFSTSIDAVPAYDTTGLSTPFVCHPNRALAGASFACRFSRDAAGIPFSFRLRVMVPAFI